jgi:hypothetical protein
MWFRHRVPAITRLLSAKASGRQTSKRTGAPGVPMRLAKSAAVIAVAGVDMVCLRGIVIDYFNTLTINLAKNKRVILQMA